MHESTQRLIELIRKSRQKFSDDEFREIYEDLAEMSESQFLSAIRPPEKHIKPGSAEDVHYVEFMEARERLSMVKTSDYIHMLMRALNKRKLLGSFQPNASQLNSAAKFYEGITRRLNAETVANIAKDLAAGRI